jgi:predicted polyphosphate/ATP-dependent NAD kinase
MLNFAFIVKSGNYDPAVHRAEFESDKTKTGVYGVSTVEQAAELAKRLVREGVQLIDLCGAFGEQGMRAVVDAIDCQVPVGYVVYDAGEQEKHDKLFPH